MCRRPCGDVQAAMWWCAGGHVVVAYKTLLSAPIPIWIGIWGLGLGLDNDLDRGTGFSYVGQQQNNKAQQLDPEQIRGIVFWFKSQRFWILHLGLSVWDEISLEKFQESRVPIPCQDQLLCNWRPFYLGIIITCISGFTEAEMLNYSSAQICSLHQDNLELVIKNINTSNCNKLNTNIISLLYTHYTDIPKELSLNPTDSPALCAGCSMQQPLQPFISSAAAAFRNCKNFMMLQIPDILRWCLCIYGSHNLIQLGSQMLYHSYYHHHWHHGWSGIKVSFNIIKFC